MKSQDLFSIDIALLLPEAANARARAANQAMLAAQPLGAPATLRLDSTHLPHITLVQLFVQRTNLPSLADRIQLILTSHPPLPLRVTSVGSSTTAAHFAIAPNPALQALHEVLMDAVQPFEEPEGGPEAFYSGEGAALEPARDGDIAWVTHFRTRSSYANFSPHITLGIGLPPDFAEPFEFTATRAAACRLGRFCTCRTVLRDWVWKLPQPE